jgi:hypothetical protein
VPGLYIAADEPQLSSDLPATRPFLRDGGTVRAEESVTPFPRSGITPVDRVAGAEGSTELYGLHPRDLGGALYAVWLLAGVLPDKLLTVGIRGFGRRGFGRRGLGPFRMIRLVRVLFVVLFTTVLGPIVLVALVALGAYGFVANRRR